MPQGAVLSPILYALYTCDITSNLEIGIKTVQFADDIAIYTTDVNRRLNRCKIERAVNIVGKRLKSIRLDLEPKKTVLVEFSKNGYTDKNMHIRINDTVVGNSAEAKFLGI